MYSLQHLLESLADRTQPPPAPKDILECLREYPYFGTLALAWLRRTSDEGMLYDLTARREIARYAAIASAGNSDLRYILSDLFNGDETDEDFYPSAAKSATPDTSRTIDLFLSKYSATDDADKESRILEQLIFNPVADYAAILAAEEESSLPAGNDALPGSNDELLNRFIIDSRTDACVTKTVAAEILPPPVPDGKSVAESSISQEDTTFSESLAKIYIRRKNYSGAYEIISKLNLKYPEKSIYFAVQLRFLEKLIRNQKLKESVDASHPTN